MVDTLDYFFQFVKDSLVDFSDEIQGQVKIYNNTLPEDTGDVFVLVRNYQQVYERWQGIQKDSYNLLVQGLHDRDARKICLHIFRAMDSLHDVTLRAPEFGEKREAIKVSLIKPDPPIPLGDVGQGRFRYSLNITIYHGENKWE